MSYDAKHVRYCDECGRSIAKAHRRHRGSDYCSTCYARVFVRRPCRLCGELARFHKNAPVAEMVCPSCARERRTCLRCSKPLPRAAKIIAGGAVCGACVPYFNERKPCPQCGRPSLRLSSAPKHGVHEKICDRCRNRLTHRTCSVCRRYRQIVGERPNGKPFCAECAPEAPRAHRCPGCDTVVPGGGRGHCLPCLNRTRAAKEVALQQLALSTEWSRNLYEGFGAWLVDGHPNHHRLLAILRNHFVFFEVLDKGFSGIEEITGATLLDRFQVAGLRAHALPVRYLTARLGITLDAQTKFEHAERHRIAAIVRAHRSQSWGKRLEQYAESLATSGTATRTSRLYLSAAAEFCRAELGSEEGFHTESMLQRFLRRHPGLRANLYRWNTFCSELASETISMPPARVRRGPPRTARELARLLSAIDAVGLDRASTSLIQRALAKAFGYSVKQFCDRQWSIRHADGAIWLRSDEEQLCVPNRIVSVAIEWVKRTTE